MDKKLKKKVETQLVTAMQEVLTRIHAGASGDIKKKIKEAGKMVAKKFAKAISFFEGKKSSKVVTKKTVGKNGTNGIAKPERGMNGRFQSKKSNRKK